MHEEDKINITSGASQTTEPRTCVNESNARLETPSLCYRKKISENAIWAVQNRKADMKGMTSPDMMLETEACNPEALSMIGRKSLKARHRRKAIFLKIETWAKAFPPISERSTLGHLITFRPEARLILHTARTVSSSEISEPRITPLRPHLLAAVVPHVIENLACRTVNVTSE